jgi:hypothetical protein
MRRFAIFVTVLVILVAVGSRPRTVSSQSRSLCVCMASRASLIMRSITRTAATRTKRAPSQPHLVKAAFAAE